MIFLVQLKNRFRNKRGSLVLSFLASSVVAVTIVAAHQSTQRFMQGAGQGMGYHKAMETAQDVMGLASLMVTRNLILCGNTKKTKTIPANLGTTIDVRKIEEERCVLGPEKITNFDTKDEKAYDFYEETLGFKNNDSFSHENGGTPADVSLKGEGSTESFSPFNSFLKSGGTITWSLTHWKKDTSVAAIFSSIGGSVCRKLPSFEPIENGFCPYATNNPFSRADLEHGNRKLSSVESTPKQIPCKKVENPSEDLENSVCDYFSAADNDTNVVHIKVEVPYVESSEDREGSQVLTLVSAVRRPLAIVSFMNQENTPVCSVKCEANELSGLTSSQVGQKPICAGFAASPTPPGSLEMAALPKNLVSYSDLESVPYTFEVKNFGPGVLLNLDLHRVDRRLTEETQEQIVLAKDVISAMSGNQDRYVFPKENVEVTDSIPCYDTGYYRPSAEPPESCYCVFPEGQESEITGTATTDEEKINEIQEVCQEMLNRNQRIRIFNPVTPTGDVQEQNYKVGTLGYIAECDRLENIRGRGGLASVTSASVYCAVGTPGEPLNGVDLCTPTP